MARFDQRGLLDRLAATGALDLSVMRPLADTVAAFHAAAEARRDHGGSAGMRWVIEGNADALAGEYRDVFDQRRVDHVMTRTRSALVQHTDRLDRRRAAGHVRQCHGDLHLRNIVLIDGHPVLFDAIEFNDEIACIDTLYDVAFLLMDLWRRDLPAHANAVLNGYITEARELEDIALLPLFLSCRAAVRAKTSASAAQVQTVADDRRRLEATAREYLSLADTLLEPAQPQLVAVGGFSGTGKSTLARGIAPSLGATPGALVLRSDEIRKQLCGVRRLDPLGPEGYTDAVTERVYRTLIDRASTMLATGRSVVVDAVFRRADQRAAVAAAATAAGAPFSGLWLDAPIDTLLSRVAARRHDPSDASTEVIRRQLAQGANDVEWVRLDASGAADAVLQSAADTIAAGAR
jgi:predicted kinase